MQSKIKINGKEVLYPFRSLSNYKEQHEKTAKERKVGDAFKAARTLTEAKKILFG
jgi:hypothetical protein